MVPSCLGVFTLPNVYDISFFHLSFELFQREVAFKIAVEYRVYASLFGNVVYDPAKVYEQ